MPTPFPARSLPVERALAASLFVIPSINGGKLLQRMLPTLGLPLDTVVVLDQGSTDGTEAICRDAGVRCVQLGRPHTYTEACNLGARMARDGGCDHVFVSNNDIAFTTDVAAELMEAMLGDPRLGIVAPSQLIIDDVAGGRYLAYRVMWDLGAMQFVHDFQAPDADVDRLEADFCELTCALVRLSAIREVGFLDDDYGFYHEDADFGFRLRRGGYASAYVPHAQIEHYTSSTFTAHHSQRKLDYIAKNKLLFQRKHLGFGVLHRDHGSQEATSWNIVNRHLHPYLRRFGLIDASRPELIFSHPGTEPFDYLYSVWETTRLPESWRDYRDAYRGVLATSRWNCRVFEEAGFADVRYAPLGIETDVFHAGGPVQRPFDETTYLWFSRNQHRKALDVTLKAWASFRRSQPKARLIVMGAGVLGCLHRAPARSRLWGKFAIADYPEDGISVRETVAPLTDAELAQLYRSVDFVISNSRSEGFGFVIAEAMACGTTPIFSGYGAAAEFDHEGALTIRGTEVPADYSDKGFGDVGCWWEPDVDHLAQRLHEAQGMDPATRRDLNRRAANEIRSRFTWRHTCEGIRTALMDWQEQGSATAARSQPAASAVAIADDRYDALQVSLPSEFKAAADDEAALFEAVEPAQGGTAVTAFLEAVTPGLDPTEPRGFLPRSVERIRLLRREFIAVGRARGRRAAVKSVRTLALRYTGRRLRWAGHRLGVVSAPRPSEVMLLPAPPADGTVSDAIGTAIQVPAAGPSHHATLFIGYVEAGLGIGESLRGMLTSLADTQAQFAIHPYNVMVETRYIGPFMPQLYDTEGRYDVNVIEMAADQLPAMFETVGADRTRASYNILRTYWELPQAPREWASHLEGVDEIWAPTRFVEQAFKRIFDGPIVLVPPCVEVSGGNSHGRAQFGMDASRFYFLFSFDYFSAATRKNPLGVLRAFQAAFPDLDENVGLVLKSTSVPEHYPKIKAEIAAAAERDPRIVVLDRRMSRSELLSLIRQSDCYVSLHRAEGFGLGMAEAMAFGKAVIGTDYSGSQDFLTPKTGYPVPCKVRPLKHGEYHGFDRQEWAEPDQDAAAALMREVASDVEGRRRRGAAAKAFIAETYGRENVGRIAERRLERVLATIRKARTV